MQQALSAGCGAAIEDAGPCASLHSSATLLSAPKDKPCSSCRCPCEEQRNSSLSGTRVRESELPCERCCCISCSLRAQLQALEWRRRNGASPCRMARVSLGCSWVCRRCGNGWVQKAALWQGEDAPWGIALHCCCKQPPADRSFPSEAEFA